MKRVAFTHFEKPDRLTGKMRLARYMVPLEELPKGAKAVGEVVWRNLPESIEEQDSTSGWLNPKPRSK
jgi:hypothetical protein